ncbi:MAG TPA: lysophospholipid acyltransferase family protein [Spirochaetota bacterium]|nr:lysophospholipid acyltransferase family protein [Spirochaetota bacterium]HPI88202.1 lysophospholipid acyltransferase family protein [Spirochaetota bacterium]HPR47254.1 lysophospholipid acyltransferase family protein [Spirochaetota bacterium]
MAGRIRVKARGNHPEKNALYICNHRSYLDIVAIGSVLPVTFLAKDEVASWPLFGRGCRVADVVFVKRNDSESRTRSRDSISLVLDRKMSIAVFPEGTSFAGPGILPFKKGPFSIAAENNFTVVPVAIDYADPDDAWVGSDTFIRHFFQTFAKKKITILVSFGPSIRSDDPDALQAYCRHWIHHALIDQKNSDKNYNLLEVYNEPPYGKSKSIRQHPARKSERKEPLPVPGIIQAGITHERRKDSAPGRKNP